MNKNKLLTFTIITILAVSQLFLFCDTTEAAKKFKGISEEELVKIEENVDALVKKIYASSLFSPEDNEKLVDIKVVEKTSGKLFWNMRDYAFEIGSFP